jgi:hypothetical protein
MSASASHNNLLVGTDNVTQAVDGRPARPPITPAAMLSASPRIELTGKRWPAGLTTVAPWILPLTRVRPATCGLNKPAAPTADGLFTGF